MFDYFANPSRFMRIANRLLLPLVILSLSTGAIGLYLGLFVAPADYQQGDTVRIIYIHVPSAWLALFGYVGLGLCGLFYVVWRHPLADIAARASHHHFRDISHSARSRGRCVGRARTRVARMS